MRPLKDKRKSKIFVLARDKQKFEQKFLLLLESNGFREDIKKIRELWGVDIKNPRLIVSEQKNIQSLLKKYHIGDDWEYLIRGYIVSNKIEDIDDPHGIEIEIPMNKEFATIKVYPETTLADIRGAYKHIIPLLKDGKTRKTILAKNFDIDTYIVNLKNKGLSHKEISQHVWSEYSQMLNEYDISRKLNRIKKRGSSIN
jgi:hypothetical protein